MHTDWSKLKKDDGFTLLELVVSLFLLAFVVVALTSGLRLGIKVWDRTTNDQDSLQHVYLAQSTLRRFIETARPIFTDKEKVDSPLIFTGLPESLQFIGQMPVQIGYGGDYTIVVKAERRSDGTQDLILSPMVYTSTSESRLPARNDQQNGILIEHIAAVSLRYFGPDRKGQPPTWANTWKERSTFPQLVAIDVTFPPGDRRSWPTLYIAPLFPADLQKIGM